MKHFVAALAVLLLAGCQASYVENLPEGATTACNGEWTGAWIGIDDDGDSDTGLFVDADCRVTMLSLEAPKEAGPLVPHFASGVVLFSAHEVATAVGDDYESEEDPGDAWLLFGWSRSGDHLELEPPDHRRIATLIVNGAFDGKVNWSSRNSGMNVIKGDAAEIREILHENDLFSDDDSIRLRRIGDDRKDVERALKKALRAKERRQ